MASSRFVLPWPLSPTKTLKPVPGVRTVGTRLRKPCSWRPRSSKRSESDAHRHDDAEVVVRLGGPEERRVELARQLERQLLGGHLREQLGEVLRVEADAERRAGVADVDLFV